MSTQTEKIKVLIPYSFPQPVIRLLEDYGFEVTVEAVDQANLSKVIQPYQVVVVNSNNKINEEIINAAPNLKLAVRAGSGFDNIDVKKASEKGIMVAITPEANVTAVAEQVFGLMLIIARHLLEGDARIREGKWRDSSLEGFELEGKTLGVLGFGRIGKKLSLQAMRFGMNVVTHDPFISAEYKKKHGVRDVSFDELFSISDIVSLHIPKTPQTINIVNKQVLAKMKKTAVLINTSRGGIVDEVALVKAIKNGNLGGAALDVFDSKPEKDVKRELIEVGNGLMVLTPHLGASTKESRFKSAQGAALQIISAFQTGFVRWSVNGDIRIPYESEEDLEPFLDIGPRLSRFAGLILASRNVRVIDEIRLTYSKDLGGCDTNPLQAAIVLPLLNTVLGKKINGLNYKHFMEKSKLIIHESVDESLCVFPGIPTFKIQIRCGEKNTVVVGELTQHGPKISRFDNFKDPDIFLNDSNLLLVWNKDRPGAVEWIGAKAAKNRINIRNMKVVEELSNNSTPSGRALMIIHLDKPVTPALLAELTQSSGIISNVLFESHP